MEQKNHMMSCNAQQMRLSTLQIASLSTAQVQRMVSVQRLSV